jgi:hypothetical protein
MKRPYVLGLALKRIGLIVLLAGQVLALTACGRQPYWDRILGVTVSADERTIVADLVIGPPKADGTSCYEVTNKVTEESTSQVIIGIELRNNCEPLFPWERGISTMEGYPLKVELQLQAPLAGRIIVDRESGERVTIRGT